MKRPRTTIRRCSALFAVVSTTLGHEDHHVLARRVQGFGVGVVVDAAPPEDTLASLSPTPMPILNNTEPSRPPTLRPSNAPSTLMPSMAFHGDTQLPTPDSTGGGIFVEDLTPHSPPPLLPAALNFHLEFQIETRNGAVQADIIDKVEVSLTTYLSTIELSLDTDQTHGPMQVTGINSTILGRCQDPTGHVAVLTHIHLSRSMP